ncbi:MAG: methylated-DNA--[protein]-cysteine S-methyltransferase [Myxococcota bacterium]
MDTIHITSVDAPIGRMRVASSEQGLAYVELPKAAGCGLRGWLHHNFSDARCVESRDRNRTVIDQILEYLEGERSEFDLSLDLRGTEFQRQVWRALQKIPFGERRSYRDIAKAVGRPKAVRAVGSANGSNPVSLIVPCHRVINSDGKLGGYGGGLALKAKLLDMESRIGGSRLF